MNKMLKKIVIFGAGAWGSALARVISQNIEQVFIYSKNPKTVGEINYKHTNFSKLGDIVLPNNIKAIDSFEDMEDVTTCVIAIPVKFLECFLKMIKNHTSLQNFIICSKGIENEKLNFPSNICKQYFPNANIAILSGPNFAKEIANEKFAKTLIASKNPEFLSSTQKIFDTKFFKTEISTDVVGVEVCGAVKNVIAIALGIAKGLELGENFLAALFVFSLNEINSLIKSLGGNIDTTYSLAGIGDLILTSYSLTSRNTKFGFALAKNQQMLDLDDIVVEGYYTAKSIYKISQSLKIQMPLCTFVYEVLYLKEDINKITKVVKGLN